MPERRYGRIVNVSSVAAIGTALPGNAFYAATKAEVAILTKRFAMELGPHNITVNAGPNRRYRRTCVLLRGCQNSRR
jgi:NAD(P)-dependent dehydrogenase (short-subunit alcohol dehydrogenase family)